MLFANRKCIAQNCCTAMARGSVGNSFVLRLFPVSLEQKFIELDIPTACQIRVIKVLLIKTCRSYLVAVFISDSSSRFYAPFSFQCEKVFGGKICGELLSN
jgi:hypothetical protein